MSMRAYLRSAMIFVGAGTSAGMLAFVSLSKPYTAMDISMLIAGSLTAGAATMAVEQGFGKSRTPVVAPGPPASSSSPLTSGPVAPSAAASGVIDYPALLATPDPELGPGPKPNRPPLVGREGDLAEIAGLLTEQQEVGG